MVSVRGDCCGFGACIGGGLILSSKKTAKEGSGVIKIGAIVPLTSPIVGDWLNSGIDLAVDEINAKGGVSGKMIQVVYEDSMMDSKTAVTAFKKLTEIDNVDVIISANSQVAVPLKPLVEEKKIPMISALVAAPGFSVGNDYVFRYHPSGDGEASMMLEYAQKELKINEVSIVYENNEYGVSVFNAMKKDFENKGGKIISAEAINPDGKDVRTSLLKIAEKSPQAVYFVGNSNGYIESMKQFKQLKINAVCLTAANIISVKPIESAEGCYFTNPEFAVDSKNETTKLFVSAYSKKYGKDPIYVNAEAYDMVYLIAEAVKTKGIKNIKDGLLGIGGFDATMGTISFDKNGDALLPQRVGQVVNGKFVFNK